MPTPREVADAGLRLYEIRNGITRIVYRLDARDLERLHTLLHRLTDDDLRAVARYAEALADWPLPESHSGDATQETDRT